MRHMRHGSGGDCGKEVRSRALAVLAPILAGCLWTHRFPGLLARLDLMRIYNPQVSHILSSDYKVI